MRRFLWDDLAIPAEQTAGIIARSAELFAERGLGLWGARLRLPLASGERGMLAGFGGFWFFRDPPELELLYGVAEPLWGRGLATEIARAMLDYGFSTLDMREIRASTDAGNAASVRVLDALGFTLDRRAVVDGLDTVFYRLARAAGDD